jgi:hypothetical protein
MHVGEAIDLGSLWMLFTCRYKGNINTYYSLKNDFVTPYTAEHDGDIFIALPLQNWPYFCLISDALPQAIWSGREISVQYAVVV